MGPDDQLIDLARAARERAYAPYSGFHVGAAVRGASGHLYSGCNVENASFGLTVCAERAVVFAAVAAGERRVSAIAVVTGDRALTPPCGACRQVLAEFAADDLPITLANLEGAREVTTLGALLPRAFRSFGKD
jgi:cytidine deaminase